MNINSKRMEGVVVFTKSGIRVGKLASIEFEAENGRLSAIFVRPVGVVTSIIANDLVIAWGSIVSMSEEKIIVKDVVVRDEGFALVPSVATEI